MADDLTEQEIIGGAAPHSAPGQEALKDYAMAKDALTRSDAAELFTLYQKAIRRRNEVESMLGKIVEHYVGQKDTPRFQEPDAINAIRDVALAAIDFAKEIKK
jgi:hypothetical protein